MSIYKDDRYRPHIQKGGGMPRGYSFILCPNCGKRGVSSRVTNSNGKAMARKICKYCGWMELPSTCLRGGF